MELLALRPLPSSAACPPSNPWRKAMAKRAASFPGGQALGAPRRTCACPIGGESGDILQSQPRASVSIRSAASSTANVEEVSGSGLRDDNVAFVAGATGKVGSRAVRELLKLGYRVRAGVRNAQRAETLIQSVRKMKLSDASGMSGTQPVEKLEIVECDLENEGSIAPAIGNASVVLCCIGASEKEIFDITGPYRIDYKATVNLIKAATTLKVNHFILLTSLGTSKFGFPAGLLNLFWGVLCWKRRAEEALIASGLPYTIVRPGGMERPTDSFKETHNLVLADEDVYFGGLVSNLQVAELMAFMARNKKLSYCKVVEVIAETTAPLLPMEDLLVKIPSKREVPADLEADSKATFEPTKSAVEENIKVQAQTSRPLSPYTAYADLKPPSSPSPTPSTTPGSIIEKNIVSLEPIPDSGPPSAASSLPGSTEVPTVKEPSRPLSPYTAYADLKPPSSPSPTPSTTPGSIVEQNIVSLEPKSDIGPPSAVSSLPGSTEIPTVKESSRPLSPYTAYADLKPPSSPSPTPSSASTTSKSSTLNAVANGPEAIGATVASQPASNVENNTQISVGNSDYRSPYPVYKDLKPPTSPTPSLPKY